MYDFVKRLIDIVGSFCAIILFIPIYIITAIAIEIESPGPVFADIPKRVGKDRKPFKLYKFRSMIPNAHYLLHNDPRYAKLLEEYKRNNYKLDHDPRWTCVGQFIRKYSIDETPQLFNVLKGEMSLVGPRPYHFDELDNQQQKFPQTKELIREVLTAKPGVSGEWQVSGRSEVNFDKRIEMDADYVRRRSIRHDIELIIKTPIAMLSAKGAV